jgi:hypothetical protein
MSFLSDYLFYNSGNEVPRAYHTFSLLVGAASFLGKRVWIPAKYSTLKVYPNLYALLIGPQGFRKSTAKDILRDTILDVNPNFPLGASTMSREAIVKFMASDENMGSYQDENGIDQEYRQLTFLINELKNFVSVNPTSMIDFLVDIYDRIGSYYDARTIKHDLELITGPVINILACETDDWVIDKLRMNIISGGFSRRFIYVVEHDEPQRIADPHPPEGGAEAIARVKDTLRRLQTYRGPLRWAPDAWAFYEKWYTNFKLPDEKFFRGYCRSKHVQLQKIAGVLSLAETGEMQITRPMLELSLTILDSIEGGIIEVGAQTGRNPLVAPTMEILRLIKKGPLPEIVIRRKLFGEVSPRDYEDILGYLRRTQQIVEAPIKNSKGQIIQCYCLPAHFKTLTAQGQNAGKPAEKTEGST